MEEQITQFLINMAPSIANITTMIILTINLIKSFKNTSNQIMSNANIKDLIDENQRLRKENAAIVQSNRELIKATYKLHQDLQGIRNNRR